MKALLIALCLIVIPCSAADTVFVKYEGWVFINKQFERKPIPQSSWIYEACYAKRYIAQTDTVYDYMVINLSGVWYGYCGIPRATYLSLTTATSPGQYYNRNIKGRYVCTCVWQ